MKPFPWTTQSAKGDGYQRGSLEKLLSLKQPSLYLRQHHADGSGGVVVRGVRREELNQGSPDREGDQNPNKGKGGSWAEDEAGR